MQAKALYYKGNLQGLASFITENLATQFDISKASHIEITKIEHNGDEFVFLFEIV